ncbi:MAG: STAS-like domain-containing protein [Candidatus Methanoperedens sp.]|nr:STAS-like domain-containing protein [Candidatus Methanoperedens sp.]MCZ7406447.1 STAS-like domain-containing protein [Candidatus Methanoperedens sp.]
MNNIVKISVIEVVGDSICVTDRDGKKVYDVIFDALSNEKEIIISFDGVTDLTSAFLNNAFGQLYGNFSEDYIKSKLSVTDLPQNDVVILKRVVDRAKSFFENPEHFKKVANAVLGDDSGN